MSLARRQTSERAELLAGVASDLPRFEEPERLVASAFRRLAETTDADLCFCFLSEEGRLRLVYADGLPVHLREVVERLGSEEGICGRAVSKRCRFSANNIQKSGDPATAFLKSIGTQAFCCYPLIAGTELVGALSFGTRKAAAFTAEEQELQSIIANEMALALDRLRLTAELERKSEALERATASLHRAQMDLDQFAFSASHDLREPLRHLLLFSDLLRSKAGDALDEDARQYLGVIAKSARRLELLVRDLLAYTDASADGFIGERNVNANEALEDALSRLSGAIRDSKASVHAGALPRIFVNPRHLVQLFRQLIENALKYHRPGVPPEIDVFARDQDGKTVFCIRDNGISIAPEYRERIFGLFKRLHTSEDYEGTGIGLAICQRIVQHYQGEIWVESRAGEGATFCFTLGQVGLGKPGGKSVAAATHIHR